MERNKVVTVDEKDTQTGTMDKLEAHRKGILHRAFSVFIFNGRGEMLIQQRANGKYHGGGLWTNACCSHPQPGEEIKGSAQERLKYEIGLDCEISPLFSFIYKADVENDLTEHEFDHVFVGYTNQNPQPNTEEVKDYQWINTDDLQMKITEEPEQFTVWFKMILPRVLQKVANSFIADGEIRKLQSDAE